MLEEQIIPWIANLGFPIAITIYLLISRDKVIDKNTNAIDNLSDLIQDMIARK